MSNKAKIEEYLRKYRSHSKFGIKKLRKSMIERGIKEAKNFSDSDLHFVRTQMKREFYPNDVGGDNKNCKIQVRPRQERSTPKSHLAGRLQYYLTRRKNKRHTIVELCDKFDKSPSSIEKALEELDTQGYNIIKENNEIELSNIIRTKKRHTLDIYDASTNYYKFGVVSDNHLGSKYSRLDVLHSLYEHFNNEGIEVVYNAGNWIDGEMRFNKHDLCVPAGMKAQVDYMLENYPKIDGIKTHYIGGDDHEGWYTQKFGIDIGQHLELRAHEIGRDDLIYMGYMEADVILSAPNGETRLRVQHPGGGSSYAISYTAQKILESLTVNEIPDVLLIGHYHKAAYNFIRGCHVIQTGCTQEQTPFMRKKRLAAHLGGWIIEMWTDDQGKITRFKQEWLPFYDKGYYETNWKYIH